MRRARLAFLVVLTVALAGCGSFAGGGQSAATESTVTPVPVSGGTAGPATETGTQSSEFPPGIYANGTVDRESLQAAHRRVLTNRSFTVTITGEVPGDSGLQPYHYRVAVGDRTTYRRQLEVGNFTRLEYSTASVRFVREYNRTTGQVTAFSDTSNATYGPRRHADLMTSYLRDEADDIDRVQRNGTAYIRLHFVGSRITRDVNAHENATRYRITAYVRPDGLVRTVVVTYVYRDDGERREYSLRLRQHDLGTTNVGIPDWVGFPNRTPDGTGASGNGETRTDTGTKTGTAPPPTRERTATATRRDGNGDSTGRQPGQTTASTAATDAR